MGKLKHGLARRGSVSREYRAWADMRARCRRKYEGVSVCPRWSDVRVFIEDMGPCPPGYTLDRIDNNGNYEPDNCRWATVDVQARNKSNNVLLTTRGRTACAADWARELGITHTTLNDHLRRGLSIGAIVDAYKSGKARRMTHRGPKTAEGKTQSIKSWAMELGVSESTISWHLNKGRRFDAVVAFLRGRERKWQNSLS